VNGVIEIARYPRGPLDLLAAKQMGGALQSLSPTIVPTFDIEKFFGAVARGVQVGSAALTNGINTTYITVPSNQVWLMRHASLGITMNAASSISSAFIWVIVPEDAGAGMAFSSSSGELFANQNMQVPSIPQLAGLLLNPGTRFTLLVNDLVGGGNATLTLLFDRMAC
jgi:hypothetical protein